MLRRFSAESTSSEQMPPLQSVDAVAQADTSADISAAAADNLSGSGGVMGGRRSRWDAPVPQAELRFHAHVGFTNADEVLSPSALSTLKPPPPLFAAAAASAASSSVGQNDQNSSSSSTDSSEDDSDARRASAGRHRSDSRSDSRSHHRAHKKSKEKKKSKSSRHRSRSRSRSRDRTHKKHHRSSGSSHKEKSSNRKKRSRSSSREHSRKKAKSTAAPHGAGIAPSAVAAVATGLKSTAGLRAEREARERTERARAAALLQVPVWAAAHPHSITQRELSDERPQPPPRFQGRHFSEFALNRRS
jgi:hypothetical protein